jgi:CelD/BcsL family acetyltransferase involved in cellulose biosynthesis
VSLVISSADVGGGPAARFVARQLAGLHDPLLAQLDRAATSAFETSAFLAALFATIGRATGAAPLIIAVANEDGDPIAIFPFSIRRAHGLRVVEGMGLGLSDYYVPVSLAGGEFDAASATAIWRSVIAALPPADIVRLRNVPVEPFGTTHVLSKAPFLRPMGHASTTLRLCDAGGAEIVVPDQMSVARDVRRKERKLAALGPLTFTEAREPEQIDALLEAMVRFRRARFEMLGRSDRLAEAGVEDFYRVLATAPDRPLARLFGLRVGGEVVAVIYGFSHHGVFTLIIPTMSADERWQAGSPGLVALYMAIDHCLSSGYCVFDFSVGAMQYKTRFGAEVVELFEHRQALSLLGVPSVMLGRARTWLRTFLGRHPAFGARFRHVIGLLRRRPASH